MVQADGKIVAAGQANMGGSTSYDFALARYDTAGVLDPSFGSGGKVTTDFGGNIDAAAGLALQADGKLVAAGRAFVGGIQHFAVARYASNGTLDPSFGSAGKVLTSVAGGADLAYAVAIQPDARIVVAGYAATVSSYSRFGLVRYDSAGSLDPSFGSGGKVTTDLSGNSSNVNCLLIQPDGKIIAGGQAILVKPAGNFTSFALVRYSAGGSLDAPFGSAGALLTDFRGIQDQVTALALQTDGKILVSGSSYSGSVSESPPPGISIPRPAPRPRPP